MQPTRFHQPMATRPQETPIGARPVPVVPQPIDHRIQQQAVPVIYPVPYHPAPPAPTMLHSAPITRGPVSTVGHIAAIPVAPRLPGPGPVTQSMHTAPVARQTMHVAPTTRRMDSPRPVHSGHIHAIQTNPYPPTKALGIEKF